MSDPIRALIIEERPAALARIAATLAHPGFRVATRLSPADALEYVARTRPDLVLLGRSWWEAGWAVELLVASPETVVLPVIDEAPASLVQEVA